MKSVSALWDSPNTDATNNSGFSGLPGGDRIHSGLFISDDDFGLWWTSSENDYDHAWYRNLNCNDPGVYRNFYWKKGGFSVRCLRDN
jgi:uncharacterized protein (TIGR02145 family)